MRIKTVFCFVHLMIHVNPVFAHRVPEIHLFGMVSVTFFITVSSHGLQIEPEKLSMALDTI